MIFIFRGFIYIFLWYHHAVKRIFQ